MNYINDDYLLGHLLKQARLTNLNRLTIDILKNKAEPAELITTPISSSLDHYIKWFPELVTSSGSTIVFMTSATMTIEFELDKTRQYSIHKGIFESPYSCEITIVDDRGKEYKHKHAGWWYPET
jgi:hypothetical protein